MRGCKRGGALVARLGGHPYPALRQRSDSHPKASSKWRHIPAHARVTPVTARGLIKPVSPRLSYIVGSMSTAEKLGSLNAQQRKAVTHGEPVPGGKGYRAGPLLIVA